MLIKEFFVVKILFYVVLLEEVFLIVNLILVLKGYYGELEIKINYIIIDI